MLIFQSDISGKCSGGGKIGGNTTRLCQNTLQALITLCLLTRFNAIVVWLENTAAVAWGLENGPRVWVGAGVSIGWEWGCGVCSTDLYLTLLWAVTWFLRSFIMTYRAFSKNGSGISLSLLSRTDVISSLTFVWNSYRVLALLTARLMSSRPDVLMKFVIIGRHSSFHLALSSRPIAIRAVLRLTRCGFLLERS